MFPQLAVPPPVPKRLANLGFGLAAFGVGVACIVRADLGVDPWTVLAEGVALHSPLSLGVATVCISFVVLLIWIPLRQRPGLGTLGNAVVVGLVVDVVLAMVPELETMVLRVLALLVGVVIVGIGSGFYIGAALGPGPRDGLMTGFAQYGWPIRRVRTSVEAAALALGWSLGGTVGVGTLFFAVAIGPVVQVTLPMFALDVDE